MDPFENDFARRIARSTTLSHSEAVELLRAFAKLTVSYLIRKAINESMELRITRTVVVTLSVAPRSPLADLKQAGIEIMYEDPSNLLIVKVPPEKWEEFLKLVEAPGLEHKVIDQIVQSVVLDKVDRGPFKFREGDRVMHVGGNAGVIKHVPDGHVGAPGTVQYGVCFDRAESGSVAFVRESELHYKETVETRRHRGGPSPLDDIRGAKKLIDAAARAKTRWDGVGAFTIDDLREAKKQIALGAAKYGSAYRDIKELVDKAELSFTYRPVIVENAVAFMKKTCAGCGGWHSLKIVKTGADSMMTFEVEEFKCPNSDVHTPRSIRVETRGEFDLVLDLTQKSPRIEPTIDFVRKTLERKGLNLFDNEPNFGGFSADDRLSKETKERLGLNPMTEGADSEAPEKTDEPEPPKRSEGDDLFDFFRRTNH